jgi:phthalate 4,5-dioxygenase reductase subunit
MRPLRVTRAEPITRDIHLFEFRDPAGLPLTEFTAGAHVTVKAPNGTLRKYSLCNDPGECERYVIAVKRSVSLVDGIRTGDFVEVSEPRNAFELVTKAPAFIFIAGGIGITPIMSMIRGLAGSGRDKFKLYYCTRAPEMTPFLEELRGAEFKGKVVVHHDYGDAAKSLDLWPILEKPGSAHIYCCGPRPMLEAVRDMTGHWPAAAVHFESFLDAAAQAKPEDRPFDVLLAKSGARIGVPPGVSILDAMRAQGHDAPSSCESGTCGTCRTRLLEGTADHRDLVLTEEERATQVMICVSRALSPEIVIDR